MGKRYDDLIGAVDLQMRLIEAEAKVSRLQDLIAQQSVVTPDIADSDFVPLPWEPSAKEEWIPLAEKLSLDPKYTKAAWCLMIVAIATGAAPQKSVMALMGSKGGKIGGKRRAANMSPDARKAGASTAARARWSGKKSQPVNLEAKRDAALRKIASILEEQMTDMGLSEEEKNAKTAALVAFVSRGRQ